METDGVANIRKQFIFCSLLSNYCAQTKFATLTTVLTNLTGLPPQAMLWTGDNTGVAVTDDHRAFSAQRRTRYQRRGVYQHNPHTTSTRRTTPPEGRKVNQDSTTNSHTFSFLTVS